MPKTAIFVKFLCISVYRNTSTSKSHFMSLFGASQYPQKHPKNTPFSALPAIYTEKKRRFRGSCEAEVFDPFIKNYFYTINYIETLYKFKIKITKKRQKSTFLGILEKWSKKGLKAGYWLGLEKVRFFTI